MTEEEAAGIACAYCGDDRIIGGYWLPAVVGFVTGIILSWSYFEVTHMNTLVAEGWLGLILTGLLFGFGFAIGQTLWSALVSLIHRKQQ